MKQSSKNFERDERWIFNANEMHISLLKHRKDSILTFQATGKEDKHEVRKCLTFTPGPLKKII